MSHKGLEAVLWEVMLRITTDADGLVSSGGNERDRWEAYCLVQAAVSGNLLLAECVRVEMNVVLMFVFTHTEKLSCACTIVAHESGHFKIIRQ